MSRVLFLITCITAAAQSGSAPSSWAQSTDPPSIESPSSFKLQTDESAPEEKTSPRGVQQPNVMLRGTAEQKTSPINTIQRKGGSAIYPKFAPYQGLIPLSPRSVPGTPTQLQGRVNDPRLNAAIEQAQRQMDAELSRRRPVFSPQVPQFASPLNGAVEAPAIHDPRMNAATDNASREINRQLQQAMPQSGPILPSAVRGSIPDVTGALDAEMARANKPQLDIGPDLEAEAARGKQPDTAGARDVTSKINGQLINKDTQAVPNIDPVVNAEMARSKALINRQAAQVSSAIRATIRRAPLPELSTSAHIVGDTKYTEDAILWDSWYSSIARLSEPLLIQALEKRGNPAGSNTLSVTITADHRVSVSLVTGGESLFDRATIEAYKSFDGNAGIAFPFGSQRTAVTFFVDNAHDIAGDVSGVNCQTVVGDREARKR